MDQACTSGLHGLDQMTLNVIDNEHGLEVVNMLRMQLKRMRSHCYACVVNVTHAFILHTRAYGSTGSILHMPSGMHKLC